MPRKEYTPIFTDETYENILNRMLSQLPNEIDKREGSINHSANAPTSLELSIIYGWLEFILQNSFGNTANRYWLIQRARERGISPYPASFATVIGKFNVDVGLNQRFSVDNVFYKTTDLIEESDGLFYYELLAEVPGVVGNLTSGKLTPTSTIRGLSISEIDRIAILGEDEEDTEAFRDRYFEEIRTNAYGGNIDDYIRKTKAIEGVGQVKIEPVWNGGGTVKVIITDSDSGEPTEELIMKVQEILDPIPFGQKGYGVAPIGHLVTVVGAEKVTIDVSVELELEEGSSIEYITERARERIENYFADLRKEWSRNTIDVRLSNFLCLLLNINGVKDYQNLTLNGEIDNKVIELLNNQIPYLGDLTITEVIR